MFRLIQFFINLLPIIQKTTERIREDLLFPILKLHVFSWITADGISFFRGILAVAFPILINSFSGIAWLLLSISVLLDAFDGVVARFQKTNSDRGKFIDMICDQLTFMCSGFGFMVVLTELMLPISICLYTIGMLYIIVIFRKNETKKTDWIIHPRAQQTIYKIIFLVIIILTILGILNNFYTVILLCILIFVTTVVFLYNFIQFILKK